MSKESFSLVPHKFEGRIAGKSYCISCGLLNLNNDFSRWAVEKGCDNMLHSQYQQKRKLTNPFNK